MRRAKWGVADQAFSSLTNFLVGTMVARSLGPTQFGAFGVVFATYGLALGASSSLTSQPLLVRFSATPEPTWRRAAASACGTALAIGSTLGVVCILLSLVRSGPVSQAYLALGIVLPGLLLQDSWRFAFFAAGRGRDAFLNDLIWAVALVPAFALAMRLGHVSLFWMVLAWGLAANVAGLAGLAQARLVPAPRRAPAWLVEHRDLGPRFLAEALVLSGTVQATVAGIATVAGLPAVAGIRGAQMLLGPAYVFSKGFRLVILPQAVVAIRESVASVRRLCAAQSMTMSGVMIGWGLTLLLLPPEWGAWLLGRTWEPVHRVLLPVTLTYAAGAAILGASAGLRALAAAKRSLHSRIVASTIQFTGGVGGAAIGGGVGAAWGQAMAGALAVLAFWRFLLGALSEHASRDLAEASETLASSPN
jgi:O-antigen/teichoic acid export membrane protein